MSEQGRGAMGWLCLRRLVSFLYVCAEGVSGICLRSDHLLCSCCVGAFPVKWPP